MNKMGLSKCKVVETAHPYETLDAHSAGRSRTVRVLWSKCPTALRIGGVCCIAVETIVRLCTVRLLIWRRY